MNFHNSPLISVIMPVFNADLFLHESIESILSQTYPNLELIIINDGSSDNSESIIRKYNDHRIKYYAFSNNKGLTEALNFGIKMSKGDFIARADADDILYKNRLELQVKYLQEHKEISLVGSQMIEISPSEKIWGAYFNHKDILTKMFFDSPIWHPTAFFRKEILINNKLEYNSNYGSEDYKLWFELSKIVKMANLSQILLRYRINPNSLTGNKTQIRNLDNLRIEVLQYYFNEIELTDTEIKYYTILMSYEERLINNSDLTLIKKLVIKLKNHAKKNIKINNELYNILINEKLYKCHYSNYKTNFFSNSFIIRLYYLISFLFKTTNLSKSNIFNFKIECYRLLFPNK